MCMSACAWHSLGRASWQSDPCDCHCCLQLLFFPKFRTIYNGGGSKTFYDLKGSKCVLSTLLACIP